MGESGHLLSKRAHRPMLLTIGASALSTPVVMRTAPINMIATTPSSKPTSASDFCYGLPGNIAPAGNFDPANILEGKSKATVYRLREAGMSPHYTPYPPSVAIAPAVPPY